MFKKIKERMNTRIQNTEQERKNNLANIAITKESLEFRADKCICKPKLLKVIKYFEGEYTAIEIEIDLLTIHLQGIIHEETRLLNKIKEKLRKEKKISMIEDFNARIKTKEREREKALRKLRENEKKLEEFPDMCKCKADSIKKIAELENANEVIDVEINLLTKYYTEKTEEENLD
jgi:hypothetical protein